MTQPVTNAVTICNSALLKMGADKISSLTQTTRAAIVCNTIYYIIRDELLSVHNWTFARKRAVLYPNATTPEFDYTYCFDIPSDCLRPYKTDDDSIKWIQEGETILSNEPTLDLKYIYRNEDESSWSALFCEAFSWRLAMDLSLCLTQSSTMFGVCEKAFTKSLAQARAINGVIGTQDPLVADIWSNARKGFRFNVLTGSDLP